MDSSSDDVYPRPLEPVEWPTWDTGDSVTGNSVAESATPKAVDSSTPNSGTKRSKIVERSTAPDNGRRSVYVNDAWSQMPRGEQETLLRGIERGDITPIDVMLVAAGSEATGVTESPGTDDDSPLGLIGRSAERMNNLQAAVKDRGGGDIGVADVNIVSSDDFSQMVLEPKDRDITSSMKAAVNGVLNVSVLDGWWDEACEAHAGWAIGRGEDYADE